MVSNDMLWIYNLYFARKFQTFEHFQAVVLHTQDEHARLQALAAQNPCRTLCVYQPPLYLWWFGGVAHPVY